MNSFPCGTATYLQTPAFPHVWGLFFEAFGYRWCAMNKETLVEVMFAIGSSAALAAVAAFVMMFVR